MAYLDLKGEGDHSMPLKRRPCSGVGGGVPLDPRDRAKAGLRESQSPGDGRSHPPEMTSGAGAVPCPGFVPWPGQPPGRGAMPSEGIKGDEWGAYVTLGRTTRTNVGSPAGREPNGDGVPVVVVGATTHRGGRESRPQGQGAQVTGYLKAGRYA